MSDPERAGRLKAARVAAGFGTAAAAAATHGWNRNTYASNENGNAPFSFAKARSYGEAYGVGPEWLYDGLGTSDAVAGRRREAQRPDPHATRPSVPLVPVIGRVGADPEGAVLFATGQAAGDLVPLPPGGSRKAVALLISGHSMRGLADDGGLIYFEDQRASPSNDMLGQVVVVETDTDEVLVKRLLRGSRAGRFDLESIRGPTRKDCKLRWAAHITAIIPPHQARKIIRTSGS